MDAAVKVARRYLPVRENWYRGIGAISLMPVFGLRYTLKFGLGVG